MIALTTHQRDLLYTLLTAPEAIGFADLGRKLGLTARQVRYSLRAVEAWLEQRNVQVVKTPGVGVYIACMAKQRDALLREMEAERSFQLVLTSGQRQQLLALHFLTADEPSILYQLQHALEASRTTILKDLDALDTWFRAFQLMLERRPHFGCAIVGTEFAQRQALTALLWGSVPFGEPLFRVSHSEGLASTFVRDAVLPPLMRQIVEFMRGWNIPAMLQHVAHAEAKLGVHFTDDTFFQLALTFAIQTQRAQAGRAVTCAAEAIQWLKAQPLWPIATNLTSQMLPTINAAQHLHESAFVAMNLLAGAREDGWIYNLDHHPEFRTLIDAMMHTVAVAYHMPNMECDRALRAGLEAHIVPACMRQRFGLWSPQVAYHEMISDQYRSEWNVAQQLMALVHTMVHVDLPEYELSNLVLLLRAAVIRERPPQSRHVLVVCPSGMATTQLLVARLRARFPHLGTYQVLSIRDLTPERLADAHLIISTVPLTLTDTQYVTVIQVHPMLSPSDVAAISQWMS
jgi:mannitol operon transcriptional antiterminator